MGSRAIIGLLSLLTGGLLTGSADSDQPSHVLTPGAEAQVRRLLDVDRPLRRGRVPFQVKIDQDRIFIVAGSPDSPVVNVTLLHPSVGRGETIKGVDVALDPAPGPAPKWALVELKRRMRGADLSVSWTAPQEETPSPRAAPRAEAEGTPLWSVDSVRSALTAVAHRIQTGEMESAQALLKAVPTKLDAEATIEVAVLWRLAGMEETARTLLTDLGPLEPPLSVATAVILGQQAAVTEALAELTPEAACGYMVVASLHERIGDVEQVVATASRIRELDPRCAEAWEMEIHGLVYGGDLDSASAQGAEALKLFPADVRMLRAVASVHQARGDLAAAVPLLERAARAQPDEPGVLRVLLGAIVRNQELRAQHRVALEERLKGGGADVVDRFLLGVIRHYANEFDASNRLLRPLQSELDHEDRLHIYIAMNDFNLGRTGDAVVRLDTTARRKAPDPDIYYCLAEILRDTDRRRALEELRRYANLSQGDVLSNPAKEVRIQGLVAGLEACLADGRKTCEGEWEHPRLQERQKEEEMQRSLAWIGGGILLVSSIFGLLARRRRGASVG